MGMAITRDIGEDLIFKDLDEESAFWSMQSCNIAVINPEGVYMPYTISFCLFVSNEGGLSLRRNITRVMGKRLLRERVLFNYYYLGEEELDLNIHSSFPNEPGLYSCHEGSNRYLTSFILTSGGGVPRLYVEAGSGRVGAISEMHAVAWSGSGFHFRKVLSGLKFAVTLKGE